jgi:SAM-dependent methyltransferase
VDGIDIEPDRVEAAARRWAHEPRLAFRAAEAEALPFGDATFDGVLLNEVLEHVRDQRAALREVRRVLVDGGNLVVFSPNRWFPFEGHGAILGPLRVGKPVPLLPWLPQRLTARTMSARNYWPHQLALIVASAGLEVEVIDFALPLFTKYPWMPRGAITWYTRAFSRLDRIRLVRRFGVSTFVLASKPA